MEEVILCTGFVHSDTPVLSPAQPVSNVGRRRHLNILEAGGTSYRDASFLDVTGYCIWSCSEQILFGVYPEVNLNSLVTYICS